MPLGLAPLPFRRCAAGSAKDRLIVEAAELRLFDGVVYGGGHATWSPAERWDFGGRVMGLNPAQLRPDLPGRLDFNVGARGEGFGGGTLDVDVRELRGTLRGTAARGSGSVALRDTTWMFSKVDVVAGGVRALLDGTLGESARDFTFRLEASDLGVLAPQSRGTLRARRAACRAPRRNRCWCSRRAAAASSTKASRSAASTPTSTSIRAPAAARACAPPRAGCRASGRALDRIAVTLDGQSEDHRVGIDVQAPELALRATADGRFATGSWAGTWDRLDLTVGEQCGLQLDGTMAMQASTTAGSIGRFCLRDGRREDSPARLCAAGDWGTGGWQGQIDATRLPLAALTAGLTPRVRYEGTMNSSARASRPAGGAVVGQLRRPELAEALLRRRPTAARTSCGSARAKSPRPRCPNRSKRGCSSMPARPAASRAVPPCSAAPPISSTCRCGPASWPAPTRSAC